MFARAIRRAVPRRNMSTNPILQCREKYFTKNNMGADLPTYTKVPGDMMFSTAAAFGFVTGILCIGRGLVNFTIGNK